MIIRLHKLGQLALGKLPLTPNVPVTSTLMLVFLFIPWFTVFSWIRIQIRCWTWA